MYEKINELAKDKTIIVVSHDMQLIKDFDEIIYINNGIIKNN